MRWKNQEQGQATHSHQPKIYLPFLWLNHSRSSVIFSSFCLYNRHDQVLFHGLNITRHLSLKTYVLIHQLSHVLAFCYLSQQLRDNFDLLSSWEQVGERHTCHPGHLHVVDHTHKLLQQTQWEVGIFQAVDSQPTTCLFITILWWKRKGVMRMTDKKQTHCYDEIVINEDTELQPNNNLLSSRYNKGAVHALPAGQWWWSAARPPSVLAGSGNSQHSVCKSAACSLWEEPDRSTAIRLYSLCNVLPKQCILC